MATYYWVGGSGNWNATSTTNWASSSGGSGGAGVPTSADDVIFDAGSNVGTGNFTVTVTGTTASRARCRDFSTGGAGGALDGTMTFSMPSTAYLECYGSMTFPATNFLVSGASGSLLLFKSTTTGKTITTNGISLNNIPVEFDGVGGEWILGSAFTSAAVVTVRNGTFDTSASNYAVTVAALQSGLTGTRSIKLNGSTVTGTASAAAIQLANTAGLTFNAGTSTIVLSGTFPILTGGDQTFYNVSFTTASAGALCTLSGNNTFNNLTFTSPSSTGLISVVINASSSCTVNGTLTLGTANTPIRRIQVASDTIGSARTITVNGTVATLADVDFRDITTSGTAGTWSGTRLGNGGNLTGITTDSPKTVYRVGTGNWSATEWKLSGGSVDANNFPLAQDTAILDTGTTTGTHTIDANWWIGSLDLSLLNVAVTLATGLTSPIIYGNITLNANATVTGSNNFVFYGLTNQTFTSAGKVLTQGIVVNKPTGNLILADNLTSTSSVGFVLTRGALRLNNNSLSCVLFNANNTNTRSIEFGTSGNIVVTGNGTTVWSLNSALGFSYTGTSNVNLTYTGSSSSRTITHATTGSPTEAIAINFNITAGSDFVSVQTGSSIKDLNFTGFTGTLSSASSFTSYGNITFSTGMIVAGNTNTWTLASTGTQYITSNGQTMSPTITQNGVSGTVRLVDNFTQSFSKTYTLTAGSLNLDGKTLTTGSFSSNNTNARSISFGSNGNILLLSNGATVWNFQNSSNFTVTGTGTIDLNSPLTKTFVGGNVVYPCTLNQGGTGNLTVTGNNTFAGITNSNIGNIILPAGGTTTVNNFSVNGTVSNLVYISSSVSGTQANLVIT